MKTIAIVGNGIIENKGSVIDGHDRVLRMNHYHVDGHEKNVGSRHDIICIRPSINPTDNVPLCSEIWMPWKLRMCINHPRTIFKEWVDRFAEDKIIEIPNAVFWKNFLSDHEFGHKKYTTTGFLAVHYAIHLGYNVSIFGFDGGVTGHYFNVQHQHRMFDHNWQYEWDTLLQYESGGKIKICS